MKSPIRISPGFDEGRFLSNNLVAWSIENKNEKRIVRNLFITSLIFWVLGLLIWHYDKGFNPYMGIGIFFSLLMLGTAWFNSYSKKVFISNIKIKSEKIIKKKLIPEWEFQDDFIKYSDGETRAELSWTNFDSYSLYVRICILDNWEITV